MNFSTYLVERSLRPLVSFHLRSSFMSVTTNERPAETANPTPERDARRRSARGNAGGPGNPFGRRQAHLREVLLRSATDENVDRLANTVMEKAFAGNMGAAELLLLFWIGKPKEVA